MRLARRVLLLLLAAGLLSRLAAAGAEGPTAPHPDWPNLAAGATAFFGTPPNYPAVTDPDDARQLLDGSLSAATPMWYGKDAVGWAMVDPVVITLDLAAPQPIRGIAVHVAAGLAGVEWPDSIQLYVSDSGERYRPLGDLMELNRAPLPEQGYSLAWLVADDLETHGRFVRLVGSPRDMGNGAYIFMDEVQVYAGDPAWLQRPLARPSLTHQWRAVWPEIRWRGQPAAVPEAERPTHLREADAPPGQATDLPLQQAVAQGEAMHFTLEGEAGRVRSMVWTGRLPAPVATESARCARLAFRTRGLRRTFESKPVVALHGVSGESVGSVVVLLEGAAAPNDGLSHTLIRSLPADFALQQIRIWLSTEDDAPSLVLERLELLPAIPDIAGEEIAPAAAPPAPGLDPVPLGPLLNGNLTEWFDRVLADHGTVMDGARALPPGRVIVSGVPFVVAGPDRNLALMPETRESDEDITFLGATVKRRHVGPVSRDDALTLPADARACEVFLLLALSVPPVQVRGGLPPCALRLDDTETLAVELDYDRGEPELAFPYSLADQACYLPARELGAYAVAVDGSRRLRHITLHNRHFGPRFAVAALTLNTSGTMLVPPLDVPSTPDRPPSRPETPRTREVTVTHEGSRLTFGSTWYEVSFDLAQGFALDRILYRAYPQAPGYLAPSSGLRIRVGNTLYTGRSFAATVTRVSQQGAELQLSSRRPELPLDLTLSIRVDESPELVFTAEAANRGTEILAAELCLPALDALRLGAVGATRLFFPQYRAVDTADPVALRAPYGPEFPLQFMDVYSRPEGIGLMLRSDNPEQRMLTFALRKTPDGVSGGVLFPAEHHRLPPGASRRFPPVSLVIHGGDWRAAFTAYRDWVRTWYRPQKAQDKDFLLNAWDIACYRPSAKVSWSDSRVPPLIDAARTRFLTEETFAFEKQYLGHVPDLVHFFNWTYNDRDQRDEYGVYGTALAYAQVGGIDLFRQGIEDLQGHWGRPVSLYTLSDRFRASALPDKALSQELVAASVYRELDGDASAALRGTGTADGIFYPPFGHPKWVEFFVRDIVAMQRDTGCRMVYMDVFPYFSHLRGYEGLSPREGDLQVVRTMREALPADVALWTEYALTDVASQYADGAVHYYFLELNAVFARRYNAPAGTEGPFAEGLLAEVPLNLVRYALPRYRFFPLPVYIEASNRPSQVDAAFANGEPFHEDTWRLHHSRLRDRLNRAYAVKHTYSDCFSSSDPEPCVETAVRGIVANRFPGRDRVLWTLYNARPKTWSGVVLTIPHHAGATYRDAWNDRPLEPTLADGLAHIPLSLHPRQPGCVVQQWTP